MVNLNGHAAGNGGHSQRTPKAHRGLLYSEGVNLLCTKTGEDDYVPHFQQRRAGSSANLDSNDWNYLDCSSGFVSGGSSSDLESQPLLGLLPEWGNRLSARRSSCLLIIWLLQQAPIGSVEACPDRHSPKRSASFSPTLPRRKPASDIWQLVGGRMGSRVRDAGIRKPMSW